MDITDAQWEVVAPLLAEKEFITNRRGRPLRHPREVLNGVLWVLRAGAPWQDMPERYPPYQTCHRRFQTWPRAGGLRDNLVALAEDLVERGKLKLDEAFIDGSFVGAKKLAILSALRSAGKGPRSWQSQTALVFLSPLALRALRPQRSPSSRTPSKSTGHR